MRKKPDATHRTFNLDIDVITLIKEGSAMNYMSQSEFIEFLVNSWDDNINPLKNLKHLRTKKKILKEDINDLEKEETLILENLQKTQEWRKIKQDKKPEVITQLTHMISNGYREDAEALAKIQSVKLGVPALQLIFESIDKLKKEIQV